MTTGVDMPVLNGAVMFDAWISECPVVRQHAGKIVSARNHVCRSDLPLEIEGVNLNEPGAIH
jgi:hypothetical protein